MKHLFNEIHGRLPRGSVVVVFVLILIILATIVCTAFTAARVVMGLLTTSFLAVVATMHATTMVPNRIGHHIHDFDWSGWVVTGDCQLTTPGASLGCFVTDDDAEAGAGMKRRREWVIDQLPVTILLFERDAGHVQIAISDVTDVQGSFCPAACLYAAEA